jgi:hypothetical protein
MGLSIASVATVNVGGRNCNLLEFVSADAQWKQLYTRAAVVLAETLVQTLGGEEQAKVFGAEERELNVTWRDWLRTANELPRGRPGYNMLTLEMGRPSPLQLGENALDIGSMAEFLARWQAWEKENQDKLSTTTFQTRDGDQVGIPGKALCQLRLFDAMSFAAVSNMFPDSSVSPTKAYRAYCSSIPYMQDASGRWRAMLEVFGSQRPEILCLQEAKVVPEEVLQRYASFGQDETRVLVTKELQGAVMFEVPSLSKGSKCAAVNLPNEKVIVSSFHAPSKGGLRLPLSSSRPLKPPFLRATQL